MSLSAAGYVANWRFGFRSVDYLDSYLPPSPVQHFWSLSVEEQFYLVWPLLLLVVMWGVRRFGWPLRTTAAVALGAVAIPSLWWSIASTGSNPDFAFFDTRARMWELALGGLVAVAAPMLKSWAPWMADAAFGFGGLAIVGSALFITSDAAWPGWLALAPVVGAALMIAGGTTGADPMRADSPGWSPLVWLGGQSYSIYLWHWPLLILAEGLWGPVNQAAGLAVMAASVLPAWATHRLIENPVRFSPALRTRPGRSLLIGLGLTLSGVVAGVVVSSQVKPLDAQPLGLPAYGETPPQLINLDPTQPIGAGWLWPHPTSQWARLPESAVAYLSPAPEDVGADGPHTQSAGCRAVVNVTDVEPSWCHLGDLTADRRIVLVGDSKANQWARVLSTYGEERGWQVDETAKASCAFSAATLILEQDKPYLQCTEWNDAVMADIAADPPDVVIVSAIYGSAAPRGSTLSEDVSVEAGVAGFSDRFTALRDMGITVIVIADNPTPRANVVNCLNAHLDDFHACEFSRKVAVTASARDELMAAADKVDGVTGIDFTDYFCDNKTCPIAIGNVVVYRTGYHVTETYLRTLAPYLAWELDKVLPE